AIPVEAEWARTPFDYSLKSGAALKDFSASLIGDFITEVTPDDKFKAAEGRTAQKLELLKAMARIWMIEHHSQETLRYGQRKLVYDLFEGYWARPDMLPLREEVRNIAPPEKADLDASRMDQGTEPEELPVWRAKARLICDHV